jgi:hypothetical protein
MRASLVSLALAIFVAGCASAPKPPPGMSSLYFQVFAEPKTGATKVGSPGSTELGYGPDTHAETGPLARIDYSEVDNIVVWLEPLDSQKSPAPLTISTDVSKPRDHVLVTSVGGTLRCFNQGARPVRGYLRGEGTFVDLGTIPAGGEKPFTFTSRGAFDLATDGAEDPVARSSSRPQRG